MAVSVPFLTPSRCVLLIGDEALYIYNVGFSVSRLVETVPWNVPDFEERTARAIQKDCGGKPVLLLYDMVEQHYRKERIPKVSPLDKANVLQRKLHVAFPNYPIRAALPLKEKPPKISQAQAAGGKASVKAGGVYLFAALPGSESFMKVMESVRRSMAPISSFCLLPVESSDMVRDLAARLSKKARTKSVWAVFIGQHQNGGLRQIVTRNGELALTRMTPIVDTDIEPEIWASEVAQEFKATMSYLSRFGYAPEDGLEVIVIANPEAGDLLADKIEVECNFTALTVGEAARTLGIGIGRQEDPRYADPLHAAWAGRKRGFILPMQSRDIAKVHRPRQIATAASFLLVVGVVYLMYALFTETQVMLAAESDLDAARQEKVQVEEMYRQEVAKKEAMGFDVELVQGTIKAYDAMEQDSLHVLPFIKSVAQALGPELSLDRIQISKSDQPEAQGEDQTQYTADGQPVDAAKPVPYEALVTMSFPPSLNEEVVKKVFEDFMVRLKAKLAGYEVSVQSNPVSTDYNTVYEGGAGTLQNATGQTEDYIAEVKIRGPVP